MGKKGDQQVCVVECKPGYKSKTSDISVKAKCDGTILKSKFKCIGNSKPSGCTGTPEQVVTGGTWDCSKGNVCELTGDGCNNVVSKCKKGKWTVAKKAKCESGGDKSDGDKPDGDEPNGDEPNGDKPDEDNRCTPFTKSNQYGECEVSPKLVDGGCWLCQNTKKGN